MREGSEVRDMGGAAVTAPFQAGGTGLPAFLSMEDIFGDLARNEGWRASVTSMFDVITEDGISTAIDALLAEVPLEVELAR